MYKILSISLDRVHGPVILNAVKNYGVVAETSGLGVSSEFSEMGNPRRVEVY